MELLTKYSTCFAAIIFAFICQSLALEPANTRVHNYGYIKSNANTRVPIATISSHLRTKRQVFYTGSRISSTEAQSLVDKHNIRRRNETASDMESMTWNTALAELAQEWADACSWGHGQPPRSPDQLPFPQIGQNLYAYTGQLSLERAMAAWSEEEKVFFNYDTLGCVPGEQCGHYTQVVWARSNQVGCAYTRCSYLANSQLSQAATYLVCNYGPAGNYPNVKPYKRGLACTDCANGKGWCDNGLCRNDCFEQGPNCECKIRCHNCATIGSDCSCNCAEGFIGTNCKDRCVNTHIYCGANPGWPLSWCTNSDESIASYVNENCPALCGTCTEFNQLQHGASESCPVVSADQCFNYPENYCSNNGRLRHQNNACICQCNAGYKGTFCNEIDPVGGTGGTTGVNTVTPFLPAECVAQNWQASWCQNGGTTVYRSDLGYCACICAPGFTNFYCDGVTSAPPTTRLPVQCAGWICNNGGTVTFNGQCTCQCALGWTGPFCSSAMTTLPTSLPPECVAQNWQTWWCQNGGTAVYRADLGYCTCNCAPGFTNFYCDVAVEVSTAMGSTLPAQCSGWDNGWCLNGGHVYYNTATGQCECFCINGWAGFWCDVYVLNCPCVTRRCSSSIISSRRSARSVSRAHHWAPDEIDQQLGGIDEIDRLEMKIADLKRDIEYLEFTTLVEMKEQLASLRKALTAKLAGRDSAGTSPGMPSTPDTSTPAPATEKTTTPTSDGGSTLAPPECTNQGYSWDVCGSNGKLSYDSGLQTCYCECKPGWKGTYCTDVVSNPTTTVRSTSAPASTTNEPIPETTTKKTASSAPPTERNTTSLPRTEKTTRIPQKATSQRPSIPTTVKTTPEAVTDADIGVILHLEVVSQFSWNSIWGTIRPKLITDVNTYCTGHPDKCCDGAEQEQHGTIDYSVSVGEGYPTPNDGSSPISVLLYSKGTVENTCRLKELPAEVLYEIIKNMQNSLNMTVKGCCGATLSRIEKSVPQEPRDDGGVPLWGYVLAGVAGFIVLAVLFILAVFFIKCKKSSGNNSYFNKEAGSTDNLGYQK